MGVLDYLKNIVNNLFDANSEWVIRISTSRLDIEKCNGEAVADDETHTCELCVALNRTIFKNEKTNLSPSKLQLRKQTYNFDLCRFGFSYEENKRISFRSPRKNSNDAFNGLLY